MRKINAQIFILLLLYTVCSCKPKTELYLERGLDILSNKKEVNFDIDQGITVKEIGVIRDQELGIKTLVFKLEDDKPIETLNKELMIGLRVWIIDKNKTKRIENWDFKPSITQIKNFKYIVQQIRIEEDQINRMKIYTYVNNNGKKDKLGPSLTLNKVNTYND